MEVVQAGSGKMAHLILLPCKSLSHLENVQFSSCKALGIGRLA